MTLHGNKREVKQHFFNIPEIYQNIHLSFGTAEVRLMQVLGTRTPYTVYGAGQNYLWYLRQAKIINIWILLWDRACMTLEPNPPPPIS